MSSSTQLASAIGASAPGAAAQANVVNAVSNNVTELLTQVATGASVNGIVTPSGASGGTLGSASVLIQDVGGASGTNQQQPVVAAAFRSPNVVAPGSQPIPYLPARSASGGAASSMPFSNGGLTRSHYPFTSMTHAAHTMLAGHSLIHPSIHLSFRFFSRFLSGPSHPQTDVALFDVIFCHSLPLFAAKCPPSANNRTGIQKIKKNKKRHSIMDDFSSPPQQFRLINSLLTKFISLINELTNELTPSLDLP